MKSFIITLIISVFISSTLVAQKHDVPRPGFLIGTGTFQYGLPTSKKVSPTYYLTLRGEGFIEKNISLAGNIDISMPKKFQFDDILVNHSVSFGANYHLLANHFDGFIGLHPGISYSKTTVIDYNIMDKDKHVISPIISTVVGARYYLGWVAHVFTSVGYTYGKQLSNQTNLPLSEVKFAAGVGFNFNTMQAKK